MLKNWQGRLKLSGEMTIEVPKAPSSETPQALRGGVWGGVVSSPSRVRGGAPEAHGFSMFRALYCA